MELLLGKNDVKIMQRSGLLKLGVIYFELFFLTFCATIKLAEHDKK